MHLLGQGAYGAVYRARDIVAEVDVAVKEYLDPDPEIQKRFRKQARLMLKWDHPQLPQVLDHFAVEDVGQYLISAYVDGVDLQQLLEEYGRLPADLIVNWLQAAVRPLAYLHKLGQLHLNLKPANMRLTPAGELFLVDSGLPALGVRPHNPGFGAPEQQAQQEVTAAADIFSLGATLYQLLTGEVPPPALGLQSGLQTLIPAREVNPDAPPYLSIAANRALSIRADARYESADDFAAALNPPAGHAAPEAVGLRRAATTQGRAAVAPRLTPSTRRQIERRTIIALSALLLIIVGSGIGLTIYNAREDVAVNEAAATATLESAVIAAMTALAPTPSPLPQPTAPPPPTPEPLLTSTGVRMLYIPGGLFRMGTDSGENDEGPAHLVRMDPYVIDETEVTNGQYALCVEDGVCNPPIRSGATYHPAYYGNPTYDDYPVIFVSWYDANTFCQWRDARLPSEAEWEMAAAFNPDEATVLTYPWGDAFDGERLNFCDVNCTLEKRDSGVDDGHRDTAPVGSYPDGRSPLGIYDLAGNVMEWVSDWYDPRYYATSTDINPLGPVEGEFKALRGGSWLSSAEEVRLVVRSSFDPTVARANLGFRCAAPAP